MTAVSLTRTVQPVLTDKQVYRLLLALTFAIFLVAVVAQRVGHALTGRADRATKSIFAEARETGSSTLLFAFMG